MKKIKITYGAMLLASVILTSCGDDSTNTNKEGEIEKGRQESTNT